MTIKLLLQNDHSPLPASSLRCEPGYLGPFQDAQREALQLHTPLESSSVDVAVFCLSLIGTDFPGYLQEAHRILKPSGWLLIAEVKSRFDPNTGF